jgi:GT2 family glycosyltransferase
MSLSNPLVSICVPCHNAERHLAAALDSALSQTYPRIEVIAVSDSSTDETGDILERYRQSHGITVISAAVGSAARSRNLAFAHTRGELIKYLDADDLISPDLVEQQVERLQGHADCIASSRWKRFCTDVDERPFESDATWADLSPADWLVTSSREGGTRAMMQCGMFLIPRPLIERAGGWDERLTLIDDMEFFGRLFCTSSRILHTSGALYYRSGMDGTLSGQKSRRAYESAVLAVEGFCRNLTTLENSHRTRTAAADLCQAYFFEIAPVEQDLGERLNALAAEFGGSSLRPPGGPVFRVVASCIGWANATRLRNRAKSLGYANVRQRFAGFWPIHRAPSKARG